MKWYKKSPFPEETIVGTSHQFEVSTNYTDLDTVLVSDTTM